MAGSQASSRGSAAKRASKKAAAAAKTTAPDAAAAGGRTANGKAKKRLKQKQRRGRSALPLLLASVAVAIAAIAASALLAPEHPVVAKGLVALRQHFPAAAAQLQVLQSHPQVTHARQLLAAQLPWLVPPDTVDTCGASAYLSDQPVWGFHPICVERVSGEALRVTAFKDGERNNTHTFDVIAEYDMVREGLEEELQLEAMRRGSSPDGKYPWEMFSPDGRVQVAGLEDVAPEQVGESKLTFVFKGGTFIWPGVRVGHKQVVEHLQGLGQIEMTTLSMTPLVFGMTNFLTDHECDHIQERSNPHLKPSPVSLMDHDLGKPDTEFRTSTTYFMPTGNDEVLKSIDQRVADITRRPIDCQEDAQVLRYEQGQRYDAHHDYFDPQYYQKDEGVLRMVDQGRRNRLATVFWYLSDVEEGGATNFPRAGGKMRKHVGFRNCSEGLSVYPEKGKVAMFYSLRADGQFDEYSLHGACEVAKGTKSAANKWVWNRPGGFGA